jgi:hypothetical protein
MNKQSKKGTKSDKLVPLDDRDAVSSDIEDLNLETLAQDLAQRSKDQLVEAIEDYTKRIVHHGRQLFYFWIARGVSLRIYRGHPEWYKPQSFDQVCDEKWGISKVQASYEIRGVEALERVAAPLQLTTVNSLSNRLLRDNLISFVDVPKLLEEAAGETMQQNPSASDVEKIKQTGRNARARKFRASTPRGTPGTARKSLRSEPKTSAASYGGHIEPTGANGAQPPTRPEPAASTANTKELYNLKRTLPKELLPAMVREINTQCDAVLGPYGKLKILIKKLLIKEQDHWGNDNTVLEGEEQEAALEAYRLPQITYSIKKLRKIVSDPDVRATSVSGDSRAIIEDAIEVIEQQCDVLDSELEDIETKKDNFGDEDSLPGRRDDAEERVETLNQFLDLNLNTNDLREALEPWQDADLSEL